MKNLIPVLQLLLSLAVNISKILADKQILEAGEMKALKENLEMEKERVQKALNARNSISHSPDSLHKDKNNRH